jgi:hypothetical protein
MKGDTIGNSRQNLFIAACRLGNGRAHVRYGPTQTSAARATAPFSVLI